MAEEMKDSEMKQKPTGLNDVEDNKLMAALSYFGILVLIPILTKKDSPFVKYHIKQGLALLIFVIVVNVVAVIPILGWLIAVVGWIIGVILFIMGIVNAFGGKTQPLPVIGPWADKNLNI